MKRFIPMFFFMFCALLLVGIQAFAQAAGVPAPTGLAAVWDWIVSNWGMVATVLLGISEALALIPGIASNSIFQLILNLLKALIPKAK